VKKYEVKFDFHQVEYIQIQHRLIELLILVFAMIDFVQQILINDWLILVFNIYQNPKSIINQFNLPSIARLPRTLYIHI